jgi:AraC-like DNA-binding protein
MSPLSNFPVMQTSDREECVDVVTRHLVPHAFDTKGGASSFKAVLNNAKLTDSTITYICYHTGINVASGAKQDAYLVVVPLSGTAKFMSARSRVEISKNMGVVIAPGEDFDIETEVLSSALIWKVPRATVDHVVRETLGAHDALPVQIDQNLDWQNRKIASLYRCLKFVVGELGQIERPEESGGGYMRTLEQLLLRALITVQPGGVRTERRVLDRAVIPRCVRKVEEYIAAYSDEALTIADITEVAGVSPRSLYRAFKQFCGVSPMEHLRDVRLRRIRQDLINAGPEDSVARILTGRGVYQFGRFAAAYRRRFGETPSQTLRN